MVSFFVITFFIPSSNCPYTVLVHVVHSNVHVYPDAKSIHGIVARSAETLENLILVAVGQSVRKVTPICVVDGASLSITKSHHTLAFESYKYIHALEYHTFQALSYILNTREKSD